jgi:ATP-dependent DNA ligase
MRASAASDPSRPGSGWLHEVKHDGFRVLAGKQGERVQVWSRRGTDFTYRFRQSPRRFAALLRTGH